MKVLVENGRALQVRGVASDPESKGEITTPDPSSANADGSPAPAGHLQSFPKGSSRRIHSRGSPSMVPPPRPIVATLVAGVVTEIFPTVSYSRIYLKCPCTPVAR